MGSVGPEPVDGSVRRRILLSSYVCSPTASSEPAAGWALLRAAARHHDVLLLTSDRYADEVRQALHEEQLLSVNVVSVPAVLGRFEGRTGLGHVDYLLWQLRAWRVALRHRGAYDVAHHATYGNDWSPCAVHLLRGVPVVWGPVGGTAPFPWLLLRYLSTRGWLLEIARELGTRSARVLTTALLRRRPCLVVAAHPAVATRFARVVGAENVVIEPQVAVAPAPATVDAASDDRGVRVALFAARLQAWKGPHLALHAFSLLDDRWRLDVYGTGPEAGALDRSVQRLGLSDRVRLLGHRPVAELDAALASADVLLFPSMHDTAPFTVAQAVRLGCPVVCLDIAGPPGLIEGSGGIAVAPGPHVARRLADAMQAARRTPPDDRWNAQRLEKRVEEWYTQALALAPSSRTGAHRT